MKKIFFVIAMLWAFTSYSQSIGYLRYDTVKIMKQGGAGELMLINATKDTLGFLSNVSGGKTVFKRVRKLNDSTLIFNLDTITIQGSGSHPAVTLAAIGSSPNANAATLTGQVLNLQPASASFGGVVNTSAQTFSGQKTLANPLLTGITNVATSKVLRWNNSTGAVTYADTTIVPAAGSYEVPLTFNNGLTRTANTIKLGGALTANTDITGAFDLNLGTVGSNLSNLVTYASSNISATSGATINLNATTSIINTVNSAPIFTLTPTYAQFGVEGLTQGLFKIEGATSGKISFAAQPAAGTYNWNYPITAGTAGYVLTSQGGGSTAMTWANYTTLASWQNVMEVGDTTNHTATISKPPTNSGSVTTQDGLIIQNNADNLNNQISPSLQFIAYTSESTPAVHAYLQLETESGQAVGSLLDFYFSGYLTPKYRVASLSGTGQFVLGKTGIGSGLIGLVGQTSGSVYISPQANAGAWTLFLPAIDGDANQVLTTDGSGVTSWTTPSGAGANTALSNLASVAINTALLTGATGKDLGSTANPFRDLYLHGAGTYATGSMKFTGTPTGNRVYTFLNDSYTVARQDAAQTFTGIQTMTAPVFVTSAQTPLLIGGTSTTQTSIYKTTTGVGTSAAAHIFQVGNNGSIEGLRIVRNDTSSLTAGILINNSSPKAWNSYDAFIQLGGTASFMAERVAGTGSSYNLSNNAYFNENNSWRYMVTDLASNYYQYNGTHNFRVAASGTADAAITWTTALVIGSTGVITMGNLAGSGSRAVLADASGVLSAPVSDFSVKQNIIPLENGIEKLMQLNPVTFEYKKGWKNYGEGTQIGFIAQEIQSVLPNSTFTTKSTGKMGYNEIDLVPLLVKGMQEQQKVIEDLKARIEKLENK